MPRLYHGTSHPFATAMAAGTINVQRGKGELGRGFYTQTSSSNAHRRGQSRYSNPAVLILDIDDAAYRGLSFKRLSLNGVQMRYAKLKKKKTKHTYTTNHDVIVGPLVKQPRIMQQKFQTAVAANLLNGAQTQRTVI